MACSIARALDVTKCHEAEGGENGISLLDPAFFGAAPSLTSKSATRRLSCSSSSRSAGVSWRPWREELRQWAEQ